MEIRWKQTETNRNKRKQTETNRNQRKSGGNKRKRVETAKNGERRAGWEGGLASGGLAGAYLIVGDVSLELDDVLVHVSDVLDIAEDERSLVVETACDDILGVLNSPLLVGLSGGSTIFNLVRRMESGRAAQGAAFRLPAAMSIISFKKAGETRTPLRGLPQCRLRP